MSMRQVWLDITTDVNTKHTVAKDLYKALAFFAGLLYLVFLLPLVYILSAVWCPPERQPLLLPSDVGFILLGIGTSIQVLKEVSGYFGRKTADASGQVLTEPGSTPPKPMPQALNPNAAAAALAAEAEAAAQSSANP
jgi:hypothetical protein